VAVVGGPAILVSSDGKPLRKIHAGFGFNRFDKSAHTIEKADHSQCWIPDGISEVDFVTGANMCFKVKLLREVGGFDEAYERGTCYYEETDPQLSLRRQGYVVLYDPRLRVDHYAALGGTRSDVSKRTIMMNRYQNTRNQVYLMRKHHLLSVPAMYELWRGMGALYIKKSMLLAGQTPNSSPSRSTAVIVDAASAIFLFLAGQLSEFVFPTSPRGLEKYEIS
jgi:GT2 family glycosyltransferase